MAFDVQRIGAELQSLLKIPPIAKGSSSDGSLNASVPAVQVANNKPEVAINGQQVKVLTRVQNTQQNQQAQQKQREPRNTSVGSIGAPIHKPNSTTFQQRPRMNDEPRAGRHEDHVLLNSLDMPNCPLGFRREREAILEYAKLENNGVRLPAKLILLLSLYSIELLEKKSARFPKAKYICSLCNYHLDNISAVLIHITGTRHVGLQQGLGPYMQVQQIEATLPRIPPASMTHVASLTRFLSETCQRFAILGSELERRRHLVAKLAEDIRAANIGCSLSLFGSSKTSLGFKDSDINVNVSVFDKNEGDGSDLSPRNGDAGEVLLRLFAFLQDHPCCSDVRKVVTSKSARIHFRENERNCEVVLSLNNCVGVGTANLLVEYCKLNSLVRVLTIALRAWAKACEIDNQENGFLPPHCFAIMVIYFLQHQDLLPNLHLLNNEESKGSYASAEEAIKRWQNTHIPPDQYGMLWLEMLRFYAIEFDYRGKVISISHGDIDRSEKCWNRKISIEDPLIPKSNLSRAVSHNKLCDYVIDRFKFSYFYFAVPRTIRGGLYDYIVPSEGEAKFSRHIFYRATPLPPGEQPKPNPDFPPISNIKWDPGNLQEEVKQVKWKGQIEFPPCKLEAVEVRLEVHTDGDQTERTTVLAKNAELLDTILPEWLYHYVLDTQILQNGQKPSIICKICNAEGHLRTECPEESLPVLRPVMNVPAGMLRMLSDVIRLNHEMESLNEKDYHTRACIVEELEQVLAPLLPEAQFRMFGSTHNGFGGHFSDVDICLTFRNKSATMFNECPKGEEPAAVVVLRLVVEKLRACHFLQDIVSILSAKVPIVKFRHRATQLEGDISCYNILAMHNTDLLRTYTEVDPRVKMLGCFLKKITKSCEISDASKGSLSSYAYVLMLIHYLQHADTPVLPVLQELDRENLPPVMIDGCDVQFFKNLQNLKYVWTYHGQNRQSLSELWIGFLNYYAEKFDFEEHVVTMSQFAPLTRVSKMWITESIAIEDPFDKSHNLGAALSRRMSVHILKTIHHLRQVFHSAHASLAFRRSKDPVAFFTDPKLLQTGNLPLDRQCRICHKIGHIARNCTYNGLNDDTPVKELATKEEMEKLLQQVKRRLALTSSMSSGSVKEESRGNKPAKDSRGPPLNGVPDLLALMNTRKVDSSKPLDGKHRESEALEDSHAKTLVNGMGRHIGHPGPVPPASFPNNTDSGNGSPFKTPAAPPPGFAPLPTVHQSYGYQPFPVGPMPPHTIPLGMYPYMIQAGAMPMVPVPFGYPPFHAMTNMKPSDTDPAQDASTCPSPPATKDMEKS